MITNKETELAVLILKYAANYEKLMTGRLDEHNENSNINLLKSQRDSLISLNLTNSLNYNRINKLIGEENLVDKSDRRFYDIIKSKFPNSILIPISKFIELEEKYDLVVSKLENFIGFIPDENLTDIVNYNSIIYKGMFKDQTLHSLLNENVYYIKEMCISNDIVWRKELNKIFNKISRYPFCSTSSEQLIKECLRDLVPEKLLDKVTKVLNRSILIDLKYETATEHDLFISCSKELVKGYSNEVNQKALDSVYEARKLASYDPIVFQITPIGILIITMWGKESEDEIVNLYEK